MSQKTLVQLVSPIKRGDSEITELSITKPTAGHLRGLKTANVVELDFDSHKKLIPRLTDLTEAEFLSLDVEDVLTIQTEVASFFVASKLSQLG
ncbi:phage tail assembly protein [Shewanella sp. VB17]|uniref:phage tail assembly protein n=1 Tax=Shewanella sp. VB17 TaxID=2739432 RepID=UPI0015638671|nr:phage tail assembly protein [Shewanella sp. VB17]NRD72722.1 phage tail assembly protein [Shewanella sp. VB17]